MEFFRNAGDMYILFQTRNNKEQLEVGEVHCKSKATKVIQSETWRNYLKMKLFTRILLNKITTKGMF